MDKGGGRDVVLAKDGEGSSSGGDKSNSRGSSNNLFLFISDGEHNGDGHVDKAAIIQAQAIEVQRLEILMLSHEASQGGSPAVGQDMNPFHIDFGDMDLRKCTRFRCFRILILGCHMQVE